MGKVRATRSFSPISLSTGVPAGLSNRSKFLAGGQHSTSVRFKLANDARTYVGDTAVKTWAEARDQCRSLGMELASVADATQDSQLSQTMGTIVGASTYWIGGSDSQKDSTWTWVDSAPWSYTNWGDGEPGGGATENCAAASGGRWQDEDCATRLGFLCMLPGEAPAQGGAAGALPASRAL